jgi:hypothetical protein
VNICLVHAESGASLARRDDEGSAVGTFEEEQRSQRRHPAGVAGEGLRWRHLVLAVVVQRVVSAPEVPGTIPAPGRRWVKWLLVVVILALVAMWVYAFGFAPRGGVNPVKDRAWTDGAKAACVRASDSLQPFVFTDPIDSSTLSDKLPKYVGDLDQSAAVIDTMLDEIEALPRTSDRAQVLVPQWLAEYRQWLADLRAWIDELRAGRTPSFSVHQTDTGIPIDERINTFAIENRIKECRTDSLGPSGSSGS